MSDPAILEAAERVLRKLETDLIWWDSESELHQFATTFLAAVTPLIEAAALDGDVLQNDLRDLLDVLGMPSGAQPRSPHAVFRDALTRMKRIRADALEEAAQRIEADDEDYLVRNEVAAMIRALISPSPSPSDASA